MSATPMSATWTIEEYQKLSGKVLLPQHHAQLLASAISLEAATTRGYWSATTRRELRDLGFSDRQQQVIRAAARPEIPAAALIVPLWWTDPSKPVLCQVRPDEPRRDSKGRVVKYETPRGAGAKLDVHPSMREALKAPDLPLLITEGIKKVDALATVGLCCVGLLGVDSWRGRNSLGGVTALAEWNDVHLKGRSVQLCFDSDVTSKSDVYEALRRLKSFLESRKATVGVIYLPTGNSGQKVGPDDYLAAGNGRDDLLALATDRLREPPRPEAHSGAKWQAGPYTMSAKGITYTKSTHEGPVDVPLTNFAARIAREVVEDDGAESRGLFEIQGEIKGRHPSFQVTARSFGGLSWVTEHLGAEAIIWPGQTLRDHTGVAIQLLSGDVERHTVFTHTGWRVVGDQALYLHAAGAIGPGGPVQGIETRLEGGIAGYRLPDPPVGDELRAAIRTSLSLLEVAPERIMWPLLAQVYRAPLGPTDFSGWLSGPTHAGKSELAALAQQHWGAGMHRLCLPANWSSTSNSLEGITFQAKDALLVIDEFVPNGSAVDVQRQHREAERLLRAQGNIQSRQRMRADTTLRPPKPPRGTVLGTGEDVPRGQSLRARLLIIEVGPDDVDWTKLTVAQAAGTSRLLASAMAGYVGWLAPQHADEHQRLQARVRELRELAVHSAVHRRTPMVIANLAVGVERFLVFAVESGGINEAQRQQLWVRAWKALGEAGEAQAEHLRTAEPTTRFLELLRAALSSGEAHLASPEGYRPDSPEAWGWRMRIVGAGQFAEARWEAQGRRIGWTRGEDVYLEPAAAFAAAQRLGQASGDALSIGQTTLERRLFQRGLLASIDTGVERRFRVYVRGLEGKRQRVLHLRVPLLADSGSPGPPGPAGSVTMVLNSAGPPVVP